VISSLNYLGMLSLAQRMMDDVSEFDWTDFQNEVVTSLNLTLNLS
jgi:hypothetical protein